MKKLGCLVLSLLVLTLAGCGSDSGDQTEKQTDQRQQQRVEVVTSDRQTAANDPNLVTLESGVRYIDMELGSGEELLHGTFVQWDYTMSLADKSGLVKAQPMASSIDREGDFWRGEVGVDGLPGLTEGVIGMKVGGIRRVHVPWELGWGDTGPMPKQNLIFEIQNVEVISRDVAEEWTSEEAKRRAFIVEELKQRQDSIRQDSINQAAGQ